MFEYGRNEVASVEKYRHDYAADVSKLDTGTFDHYLRHDAI